MTHPLRHDQARVLAARLAVTQVVTDPMPDAAPNPLRTAALAWGAVRGDATHHVVLQDDIAADVDLLDLMAIGSSRHPAAAVTCYTNWDTRNAGLVRLAAIAGAAWVRARPEEFTPMLALCMPAAFALGYRDHARDAQVIYDDEIMSEYLRSIGGSTYLSVPNLVEHIGDDSISGMNHLGIRRSACYLSMPGLARLLTDGPTVETVPFVPYLCDGRSNVIIAGDASCVDWHDALPAMSLSESDVLSGADRTTFAAQVPWSVLSAEFGDDYAWALWSHGFLVGWQAERIAQGLATTTSDKYPELAALVRQRAVETVAIAGLPRQLRGHVDPTAGQLLTWCVRTRIDAGRRHAAQSAESRAATR